MCSEVIPMIEGEPRTTLLTQEPSGDQKQISLSANSNGSFSNSTWSSQSKIIIRTEEVVIVSLVLVLWIAAIALFFNRWGKIRMLEPYQPKFIQQHRPSCPLVVDPIQHRSFSKFNINGETCKIHQLRPRQNSVFVGSSVMTLPMNPPRKVKSAFDIQNLILSDTALNRSIIKLDLMGSDLRRSSLRTTLNIYPEPGRSSDAERRLSFKDECPHVERVQCCIEREPTDGELNRRTKKPGESRQMSNQSSVSDSRHNSITNQDTKSVLRQDRRSSLLPRDSDACSPNFRRNSVMFITSPDNDKNYLLPRNENIKSGVIDFRRNSMLIINNLNEDVGIRPVSRNMSLGGSNVNLGSDFPFPRRSSLVPPFCHEHKPKVVKNKPKSGSLAKGSDSKFLVNQKPSKSLDSSECAKSLWKSRGKRDSSPVNDTRMQFLAPVTVQGYAGSTASLNADGGARLEERKPLDESKSTGNLALDKFEFIGPRIIETICTNDEEKNEDASSSLLKSEAKPGVNLTTSLSNINITSGIPLNVITSSGGARKSSQVEISHV